MPNHVINHLTFDGEKSVIKTMLNEIKGQDEDGYSLLIDFNKIVPMPEEEEDNWYDWRCEHWGTKWNAYEQNELVDGLMFWTAWSNPKQVIIALSKKYPSIRIDVEYADEDYGNNCGKYSVENGIVSNETIYNAWRSEDQDYIEEAQDFARYLWGEE